MPVKNFPTIQSRGSSILDIADQVRGLFSWKSDKMSPVAPERSDCRRRKYLRAEGTGDTMSDAEEEANTGGNGKKEGGGGAKNHNKYRKDKPWDSASIDHWSIPEWKDETMKVKAYFNRGRFAP